MTKLQESAFSGPNASSKEIWAAVPDMNETVARTRAMIVESRALLKRVDEKRPDPAAGPVPSA